MKHPSHRWRGDVCTTCFMRAHWPGGSSPCLHRNRLPPTGEVRLRPPTDVHLRGTSKPWVRPEDRPAARRRRPTKKSIPWEEQLRRVLEGS